ncbi:MAG TPA: ATP-binding protein [Afifellaceae bacterium]|nr:ATP-binding protein [Afifellaceae bacterium]
MKGFGSPITPNANLVLCRDRGAYLIAGLAGALSFPLMVVAAIGSGLPFGVASSLSVAYLAAAAPRTADRETVRLMRIITGLAGLWSLSCIAGMAAGAMPALFGLEALAAAFVASVPFVARAIAGRRIDLVEMTGVEMGCLETYAAGEAVIVVDPVGRVLGSTWAARKATGMTDKDGRASLLQLVHGPDRQPLAAAMARVSKGNRVESCVVRFLEDDSTEPGMVTIRPAAFGRLAVVLSNGSGRENGALRRPDPVQLARRTATEGTQSTNGSRSEMRYGNRNEMGLDAFTEVRDAVEFAVRLVERDAQLANVEILLADAGHCVDVAIDRRSLVQVLINLLNNAIKFSNRHSQVNIDIRQRPGAALLRIADRGIGIAAEDQQRIFNFRGRAGDGSRQGHGLGLAIVRDIVEDAGGSIVLSSEPGTGTTVDVRLPLADRDRRADPVEVSTDDDRTWQIAAE